MKYLKIFLIIFHFAAGIMLGEKKALLVGIADYKNLPTNSRSQAGNMMVEDLKGPLEDVEMAKRFLISIGFEERNIRILRNNEATREEILRNIDDWLIRGTRENDLVFFYFSGHGTQIPDFNGDERDGQDEALCAYNLIPVGAHSIEEAGLILDDELGNKFRELRGRKVLAVIDSCHSESTTTRGRLSHRVGSVKKKYVPVTLDLNQQGRAIMRGIPTSSDIPEGQIFFFSSMENQTSFELLFEDNKYHGIFSYFFLKALVEKQYLSIREIFEKVKKDMYESACKAYTLFQTPVFEPNDSLLANQTIINFLSIASEAQRPSQNSVAISNRERRLIVKLENNALRRQINDLSFIEIANNEYFDRFVKGNCTNRNCDIKVLNRLGDSINVRSIEELKKVLKYAYFAKMMLNLENVKSEFKIKLEPRESEKYDYIIGERIVFRFYTEGDCNLFLIYSDSKGNFEILFPNRFSRNNFIRAGSTIYIPSESQNFDLQITEPAGEDTIKAICIKNMRTFRGIKAVERDNHISIYAIENIDEFYSNFSENILSQDTIVIRTFNR